ncbi:MAG: MBL fold metallo-hydrolase [Candidatus Dormibacteria bacterium]
MSPVAAGSQDWSSGSPEEVASGIFRIPLPLPGDGLKAVNAYLLRAVDGDLLIDCGWDHPASWRVLASALNHLGSAPHLVRHVFATHFHGDHLGAAGRIREASRALVTLGLGDRESALILATDPELASSRTGELLRRHGAASVVEALNLAAVGRPPRAGRTSLPDLFLTGGLLRFQDREMEVLPTPGHTRGHLCLFDRSAGILFAGDHVLPHITPSIGVEFPDGGLPLRDFLGSLDAVRELPARLVLPAHGPAFADLGGRVDQLLEHHRHRLRLCREAVEAGATNAMAVAQALRWTRRERRFAELDAFNQMLAVGESAAHLELLAARGELLSRVADDAVEFGPLEGPTGNPRGGDSR